jgi:HK97 family phage major capsid protein
MIDKGGKPTLLGRPVVNPEGMPDVAANAYPVLLGDFKAGYKIRDRSGVTITRLTERYAEYDQTGFMLKKRVGGGVALAEAFTCLKIDA